MAQMAKFSSTLRASSRLRCLSLFRCFPVRSPAQWRSLRPSGRNSGRSVASHLVPNAQDWYLIQLRTIGCPGGAREASRRSRISINGFCQRRGNTERLVSIRSLTRKPRRRPSLKNRIWQKFETRSTQLSQEP